MSRCGTRGINSSLSLAPSGMLLEDVARDLDGARETGADEDPSALLTDCPLEGGRDWDWVEAEGADRGTLELAACGSSRTALMGLRHTSPVSLTRILPCWEESADAAA